VLHRLLGKLKAAGHRVVLFTQFTLMLDILQDYCERAGHTCAEGRRLGVRGWFVFDGWEWGQL
jgi:hypothetical protein